MLSMINISLACIGIILLSMGITEVLYVSSKREALTKLFVVQWGLLLVGLGFSLAAMRGQYRGHEIYIAILALVTAGPFMMLFPGKPRALLRSLLEGIGGRHVNALLLFDASIRAAAGAAFLHFSGILA